MTLISILLYVCLTVEKQLYKWELKMREDISFSEGP